MIPIPPSSPRVPRQNPHRVDDERYVRHQLSVIYATQCIKSALTTKDAMHFYTTMHADAHLPPATRAKTPRYPTPLKRGAPAREGLAECSRRKPSPSRCSRKSTLHAGTGAVDVFHVLLNL